MFLSHFKTAFRSLLKHKGFTLINLAGLAIGIAGSLAVFLWVADEISYDRFHTNADNIYRCYRKVNWDVEEKFNEVTSAPIGPTLAKRSPAVLDYVRTAGTRMTLRYDNTAVVRIGMCVDSSFLTVFSFPLIEGSTLRALSEPNSIVLTKTTALGLFGDEDPVGKVFDNGLTVTGVADDPPVNSSIQFDFLVPFSYGEQAGIVYADEWWDFNIETYFLVREDADIAAIGEQVRDLFVEVSEDANIRLHLQSLKDMHLRNPDGGGRIVTVYAFSLVAILILAVACINFMNLATARADTRMAEIVLKKIAGAGRIQLAAQILAESVVQTFIAVILAVCVLEAALPYLDGVVGKHLVLEPSLAVGLVLAGVVFFAAIAAGGYPAAVLSSFQPVDILKRQTVTSGGRGASLIRRGLVIFQFAVSTALILGALVIYSQLNLIAKKDLGIDRDNIVCLRTGQSQSDEAALKNELLKHPGILGVTGVFEPPAWCGWYQYGFDYEGKSEGRDIRAGVVFADYDYVNVFGLDVIRGRNFSSEFASDEAEAFLVNETAARAMEMDDPVGRSIDVAGKSGRIVGVVRDFHFSSLHDPIRPLMIDLDQSSHSYLCVKVSGEDVPGSLEFIEQKWWEFRPGEEFKYTFFDDLLSREYQADARTGRIVLGFTALAVLVACLGLLGLAAFGAGRRRKEIGIRKIHGASLGQLVRLVSREYFLLVIISSVIAGPIAYFAMTDWLQGFAYRIDIGWQHFLIATGLVLVICALTVSIQAIRAAIANPIDAIRSE